MLFRSIVGTYWRVLLALRVETLFRSIVGTYWRVLGFSFSMGKMTEPTLSVLQHLLEQAGEHDIPNLYVYVHVYIYIYTHIQKLYVRLEKSLFAQLESRCTPEPIHEAFHPYPPNRNFVCPEILNLRRGASNSS